MKRYSTFPYQTCIFKARRYRVCNNNLHYLVYYSMNLGYAAATVAELVVVAVVQLQRQLPDSIDFVGRPRLLVVVGPLVAVLDATQLNI